MIKVFNRNQLLGILLFIASASVGLLWEKNFHYADLLDIFLGFLSAIGIGLIFKLIPFKLNTRN